MGRLTCNGANNVVKSGNQKGFPPGESQSIIHYILVVVDNIYRGKYELQSRGISRGILTDAGELSKDLNHNTMHETIPPLGDSEHDTPATDNEGFLRKNGLSDLTKLRSDPFIIVTSCVQPLENPESFFFVVLFDELTRRFGEPF